MRDAAARFYSACDECYSKLQAVPLPLSGRQAGLSLDLRRSAVGMTTDSSAIGVQTIARSYFCPLPYSEWPMDGQRGSDARKLQQRHANTRPRPRAQFVSLPQSSFTADSSSIKAVNFSSTCADEALSVAAMRISNPDRAAWIAKIE